MTSGSGFVNKASLVPSHAPSPGTVVLSSQWSGCDRNHVAGKGRLFIFQVFTENVCWPQLCTVKTSRVESSCLMQHPWARGHVPLSPDIPSVSLSLSRVRLFGECVLWCTVCRALSGLRE